MKLESEIVNFAVEKIKKNATNNIKVASKKIFQHLKKEYI